LKFGKRNLMLGTLKNSEFEGEKGHCEIQRVTGKDGKGVNEGGGAIQKDDRYSEGRFKNDL
jgi:hypothetical protein